MKTLSVAFLVLLLAPGSFAQSTSTHVQPTSRDASGNSPLDNWMFYSGNKHWYHIIPVSSEMSWHSMRDSADNLQGHLATIDNEGENNALASFVNPNLIFIGATDEVFEGNWLWITGEPFDFTAWKSGHPNPGSPNANFLVLDPSDSLWVDTVSILNDTQILVVEYDSCCRETAGDVNCDGRIDIADLTHIIDHLFIFFPPLCCQVAGNMDGDPLGIVDVGDLTFYIDHLFITFPSPAACR